jgi:hypothetical protein
MNTDNPTTTPPLTLPCPTAGCEGELKLQQKKPLTYWCPHCRTWKVEEEKK